jgi:hypothetical protein
MSSKRASRVVLCGELVTGEHFAFVGGEEALDDRMIDAIATTFQ